MVSTLDMATTAESLIRPSDSRKLFMACSPFLVSIINLPILDKVPLAPPILSRIASTSFLTRNSFLSLIFLAANTCPALAAVSGTNKASLALMSSIKAAFWEEGMLNSWRNNSTNSPNNVVLPSLLGSPLRNCCMASLVLA